MKKVSANLGYWVICKCKNGNVIPAFTDSFSSAMEIAERFTDGEYTKEIKIVKISTGAIYDCIF